MKKSYEEGLKADMHVDGKSDESVVLNDHGEQGYCWSTCGVGRGKGLSQEERQTNRPATDSEPNQT
jgi:hypothetical protein